MSEGHPEVRRWEPLEPLDPPPAPAHRYALPRETLRHFPSERIWEGEARALETGWAFPEFLASSGSAWVQTLRGLYAQRINFPAALSPEAGLLLHSLVRNVRPRVAAEVGTFLGVSTIWMAAALPEGSSLHSFDDFSPIEKGPWRDETLPRGRLDVVAATIARAGLGGRVVLHHGNSSFAIRGMSAELRARGGVDLAFLDGDHGRFGLLQDFWSVEPLLNTGGYVILHDVYPELCDHDGPRHLLDHLHARAQGLYEKCEVYLSPLNYGLAVLRRIG